MRWVKGSALFSITLKQILPQEAKAEPSILLSEMFLQFPSTRLKPILFSRGQILMQQLYRNWLRQLKNRESFSPLPSANWATINTRSFPVKEDSGLLR